MAVKTVVVTGAAGFIGSTLVDACLKRGWRVIGIDSFTDYYDPAIKRNNCSEHPRLGDYTLVERDLLDLDLEQLLSGTDYIFHLAAQPGVRASWDEFPLYLRRNLDATQRLLEATRRLSVEKVVIASSSSVYGDAEALPTNERVVPKPVSPYGVTKAACEHLASVYSRNFDVPTVCLRYFTVFGPRQRPDMAFARVIAAALAGEAFHIFGDGFQSRDFTYVADAVAGTIAAAELGRPGANYNIGGGSRRTMNDVLNLVDEILDKPVERIYAARQAGDARDTAADISLARAELEFRPATSFAAGLGAQIDWHRSVAESRSLVG